jgi:hypothetical protein
MKISKTHQEFAYTLQGQYGIPKQDVRYDPENYLGPNWGKVINFWLYLDTLTEDQLRVAQKRYFALSNEERSISYNKAWVAAGNATRYSYNASHAAYSSVSYANGVTKGAIYELIGLDKLLEQGHELVFFPMFLNP